MQIMDRKMKLLVVHRTNRTSVFDVLNFFFSLVCPTWRLDFPAARILNSGEISFSVWST